MSAASYIGRVGGLAVALGVGTAIVTGAGGGEREPAHRQPENNEADAAQETAGTS